MFAVTCDKVKIDQLTPGNVKYLSIEKSANIVDLNSTTCFQNFYLSNLQFSKTLPLISILGKCHNKQSH